MDKRWQPSKTSASSTSSTRAGSVDCGAQVELGNSAPALPLPLPLQIT